PGAPPTVRFPAVVALRSDTRWPASIAPPLLSPPSPPTPRIPEPPGPPVALFLDREALARTVEADTGSTYKPPPRAAPPLAPRSPLLPPLPPAAELPDTVLRSREREP